MIQNDTWKQWYTLILNAIIMWNGIKVNQTRKKITSCRNYVSRARNSFDQLKVPIYQNILCGIFERIRSQIYNSNFTCNVQQFLLLQECARVYHSLIVYVFFTVNILNYYCICISINTGIHPYI